MPGGGCQWLCLLLLALPGASCSRLAGTNYRFKADVANTGAATVNFNSLGAKTIAKVQGGITTALTAGDIQAGQWVSLTYDGTQMQMTSQLGNGSSGGAVTESSLSLSDVTTANASASRHGFLPKLPNDGTKCLLGDGTYGACTGAVTANDLSAPVGCQASGGNSAAYSCSLSPAPSAYVTGTNYRFKADVANTGAATVNFNSLGAKAITKVQGGITTVLAAGDIQAGQWVSLTYDGTQMQMTSQLGNGSSGGAVTESSLSLSDITTGDASASRHGFLPKLPNDNTKCLLGDGTYGACTGTATATDLSAAVGCQASGGNGAAYSCSLSPAPSAYVTGTNYRFKADVANTGAATVNFNSLGAKAITKVQGGITTALAAGDIQAGQWISLTYDGTQMQMASQLGNAAGSPTAGPGITVSGTTVSWNRMDMSIGGFFEDFMWQISAAGYGWTNHAINNVTGSSTAATVAATTNGAQHPGVVRLTLPTTANPVVTFFPSISGGNGITVTPGTMEWDYVIVIYLGQTANARVNTGLLSGNTAFTRPNSIDIHYDTAAGDSNWMVELCSSNTCTTVNTGVAPTIAWHTLTIKRRVSGVGGNPTIYMTVDGTQKTFCSSGCDGVTTNLSAATMQAVTALGYNGTAGAAPFYEIDAVGLNFVNLTRN